MPTVDIHDNCMPIVLEKVFSELVKLEENTEFIKNLDNDFLGIAIIDTSILLLCSIVFHYAPKLCTEGECFKAAEVFFDENKIEVSDRSRWALKHYANDESKDVIFGGTFLMLILESFAKCHWPEIPALRFPKDKKLVFKVGRRIRSILVDACSMNSLEIE